MDLTNLHLLMSLNNYRLLFYLRNNSLFMNSKHFYLLMELKSSKNLALNPYKEQQFIDVVLKINDFFGDHWIVA